MCCRYAGFIRCTGFKKEGGKVTEVHATFREPKEGEKPGKVGILISITPHLLTRGKPATDAPRTSACMTAFIILLKLH